MSLGYIIIKIYNTSTIRLLEVFSLDTLAIFTLLRVSFENTDRFTEMISLLCGTFALATVLLQVNISLLNFHYRLLHSICSPWQSFDLLWKASGIPGQYCKSWTWCAQMRSVLRRNRILLIRAGNGYSSSLMVSQKKRRYAITAQIRK